MSNNQKIPQYSEDKSTCIGKRNLEAIRSGKGKIKFSGAYIQLAPVCNFRCKGCFTHMEMTRSKRLELKTIKRIVDFSKDRGVKSIIFSGAGEPTLDPEFNQIINYIKERGLQTVLFTNLTTINEVDRAKELLDSGPVIGKLYTLDEKKFEKITGFENAYQYAIRGMEKLLQAKQELENDGKNVTLGLDSYISQENFMDLPELLRYCRKNDIIPYFEAFIELGQPKNIIRELALSEKKLTELFFKLQKIDKEEFDIETEIKPLSRHYGMDVCKKATHMYMVSEDGNVYMCVCSLRKIGNIHRHDDPCDSLEEIFNVKNKWLLDYFGCDKCSKTVNPRYFKPILQK